jgi:hexosaminidase
VRRAATSLFAAAAFGLLGAAQQSDPAPAVLPPPAQFVVIAGCRFAAPALTVPRDVEAGARELVDERWRALGIPRLRAAAAPAVSLVHTGGAPQSYRLEIDASSVRIESPDAAGTFYAFATLAQLARPGGPGLLLPCVRVEDAPALRWRVLSDDVSRGPLPTMDYFRARIRTIAAFKMNGYSPYMEHVFADPRAPLAAPLDGITPDQLRELARYAARFHVALIPEQQTFAHMHGTLEWEEYAALAELPHGYLISPANPAGDAYVRGLIGAELAAVGRPPFFHIGSDEPLDLGRGQARALVAGQGLGSIYADHVLRTIAMIAPSGARPMIWDDAVQEHPELFARFPKSLVFINWHYGSEPTYAPYIERIANAGFDQMVSPGANNWNEFYPDLAVALPNIARFVSEGKEHGVLGLFQTVWHDDGQSLYEATWYPVTFAAVQAWSRTAVARDAFAASFGRAFFGSADPGFADDIARIGAARALLEKAAPDRPSDALFWSDPFAADLQRIARALDLAALRLTVEPVIVHLRTAQPPLQRRAAAAMLLAAWQYDALARQLQIGGEARGYYEEARASAGGRADNVVYRDLNVTKYLFWEQRDTLLTLKALVHDAWTYESRPGRDAAVLARYDGAVQRALARADAVDAAASGYAATHALPPFDDILAAR